MVHTAPITQQSIQRNANSCFTPNATPKCAGAPPPVTNAVPRVNKPDMRRPLISLDRCRAVRGTLCSPTLTLRYPVPTAARPYCRSSTAPSNSDLSRTRGGAPSSEPREYVVGQQQQGMTLLRVTPRDPQVLDKCFSSSGLSEPSKIKEPGFSWMVTDGLKIEPNISVSRCLFSRTDYATYPRKLHSHTAPRQKARAIHA